MCAGDGDGSEGWEMEDLDLPPEVTAAAAVAGPAAPFTAPVPGQPASQKWLDKRTSLAADHVAAGSFQSAMSLLHRQLGEPLLATATPLPIMANILGLKDLVF